MPYIPLRYDPQKLEIGIAHIGLGAFHRAHEAFAWHELLQQGQSNWGICAISLRGSQSSLQCIDALKAQNYRYLLALQDREQVQIHEVGSIIEAIDAVRDGTKAVCDAIARAHIVSLSVTEKGYYGTKLDEQHPDILYDLGQIAAAPNENCQPKTVLGFLALGLLQRFQSTAAPLTLLSCDNIPNNSATLRTLLLRFLAVQTQFAELRGWVETNCHFPCTVVDRITPKTDEETQAKICAAAGSAHNLALAAESFGQWVIEDDFASGLNIPEILGKASGVSVVRSKAEIHFYEEMKLRLLNGSHSFLAYCGYLAGKEYIFECMQDATLRNACLQFIVREQLPGLSEAKTALDYAHCVIERYENPHIFHRCHQIAMDGSLKIPQRWLNSYRSNRLQTEAPEPRLLSFGLAAWLIYLGGRDMEGQPITVEDPNAQTLQNLIAGAAPGCEAAALFSFAPTFGTLCTDNALIARVQQHYQSIRSLGLLSALKAVTETHKTED